MTKFAAYGPFAVYAVGTSPDEATVNAQEYAPGAGFGIAEISEVLYAQIESDGWNPDRQSFTLKGDVLTETTDGS